MQQGKPVFYVDRFSEELLTKRVVKKRMSMRDACEQIGISPATLSRLENKGIPDVYTYYACCKWLDVSMEYFFEPLKKTKK